jgi:hypothetical protein
VPRKREPAKPDGEKRRQYNISFQAEYATRIERVAELLGLDAVQLLRMIVREHLGKYEKRADAVERGDEPDE